MTSLQYEPTWADVLEEYATEPPTALRLIAQLGACEASALAFCRLLERWARGDAQPATPGARQSALRHAADRIETALAGLEAPLQRYLLELEADEAEGRSWYGAPGAGELVDWEPVLSRAGVHVLPSAPRRTSSSRSAALEGLRAAARIDAMPIHLALGRTVRPAREPARPHDRRPARARRPWWR